MTTMKAMPLTVACVIAGVLTAQASAAILIGPDTGNGDFSDGANDWKVGKTGDSDNVTTSFANGEFTATFDTTAKALVKLESNADTNYVEHLEVAVAPGAPLLIGASIDVTLSQTYSGGLGQNQATLQLTYEKTGGGVTDLRYSSPKFTTDTTETQTLTWEIDETVPADFSSWHTGLSNAKVVFEPKSAYSGTLTVDNVFVTEVPEPASLTLLGLGGLAMVARRRR